MRMVMRIMADLPVAPPLSVLPPAANRAAEHDRILQALDMLFQGF